MAVAGVVAWVEAGTGTGVSLRSSSSLSIGISSKSSLKSNLAESYKWIFSESFADLRFFRRTDCLAAASTNSMDVGLKKGFFRALGTFSGVDRFGPNPTHSIKE